MSTVGTVGFIGLGQIGAPMATRLLAWPGGLQVFDLRPEAMVPLVEQGAVAATGVTELGRACDVVSVMVLDDAQVRTVVDDLLLAERPGQVIAVHSTIRPETAEELAARTATHGVTLFDVPVSGGFMGAHEGTLAAMVGGDRDAFDRVQEVFGCWATLVVHMGPAGAGTRTKLARNLMHFIAYTGAGEAQRLAEAAGLDLPTLARVVRHSDVVTGGPSAIMVRDTARPMEEDDGLREIFEHTRRLGEKDLTLALELADAYGLDLPLARQSLRDFGPSLGLPRGRMTDALVALSRAELALVGRELMLAAHLQDRVSIPTILRDHPMAEANEVAIEEWMTASPVYTQRMQRLMGFTGHDVATIFKGIQLDVGMPHQFLDAGYRVADEHHGEFWLRSCGALADVRPMGADMVHGMCHDIEDPTFDATAAATNPRAQIRPLHRPPEVPLGGPDCHWTVTIDEAHPAVAPHPGVADVADSRLASLPNEAPVAAEAGGWDDYGGPFDPHFELEDLSHPALCVVNRELAIQGHLLARAICLSVERRHDRTAALEVGRALFEGIAWVASERMAAALGGVEAGPRGLLRVLPLTHLLLPADYLGLELTIADDGLDLAIRDDAPALLEGDPFSLASLLADGATEIIQSLANGVDRRAVVEATGPRRWRIGVPHDGDEAREPATVRLARFSTGPTAVFVRRRPVRDATAV